MDWNWFFSTLSQSAAATTGIFGAFIISKIFSNQAVFLEKKNRLKMLLAQANKISSDAATCDIAWYSQTINDAALKNTKKTAAKSIKGTDASQYNYEHIERLRANEKFSAFTPINETQSAIRKIIKDVCSKNLEIQLQLEEVERQRQAALKKLEDRAKKLSVHFGEDSSLIKGILSKGKEKIALASPMQVHSTFVAPDILPQAMLDMTLNKITQLYSDAKHHSTLTSDFLDSIKGNPESPPLIAYSLLLVIMIFILGVIYPLSFMPMAPNSAPVLDYSIQSMINIVFSFKGFLLVTISTFFIIVMSIFAHSNRSMKYPDSDIETIEKYTDTNNYSEHFIYLNQQQP